MPTALPLSSSFAANSCVASLVRGVTHWYVWHDMLKCVPWLIQCRRDLVHGLTGMSHDSLSCVKRHIEICAMTHWSSPRTRAWPCWCVTWLIDMCDMTYIEICAMTHRASPPICAWSYSLVTWIFFMCLSSPTHCNTLQYTATHFKTLGRDIYHVCMYACVCVRVRVRMWVCIVGVRVFFCM